MDSYLSKPVRATELLAAIHGCAAGLRSPINAG
jgi:hypothetical protein